MTVKVKTVLPLKCLDECGVTVEFDRDKIRDKDERGCATDTVRQTRVRLKGSARYSFQSVEKSHLIVMAAGIVAMDSFLIFV